ncbi:cinnamoyl-CoA reductase 1-like [Melia azedarach]|uniref:Cinnamoyl-CoA reductase 1-like n=1 Tax=Melia azedarach TaxID=155640 RepID=A0ACC1XIU8_MELAZ|nr:cinnamoyl-CoA reductase 1-like [Melia azedarach]
MTEHLHAFDGAKERLHFFKANLLEEASFDSAVDGCDGVFHVASPVTLSANDPEAKIVDTAVKGTANVLQSCAKVHSIKRVVVTSSIAAIANSGTPLTADVVVDETWVSKPDVCRKSKNWYALSKTLAEDAAWKLAKQNGIDLVTIHPGFVIGPFLQPNLNLSVQLILDLVNGAKTFPSPYRFVDVRDVAYAHIQALELSSANGRYLIVGRVIQLSEVCKILHQHYPALNLPDKFGDAGDEQIYQVSKERAKSLGMINYILSEVSLRETVESLKEKGFLKFSG